MDDEGILQIRSFRVCFKLERRIHKIDRWRLPLPYGIPLRGIGYAAAVLVAMLFLSRLPVIGGLLELLSPWLRYAALPVAIAYLLTQWKVDGRAAHAAGLAWLLMQLRPKRVSAFRPAAPLGPTTLGDIAVASDERSHRYRRGVVEGPATVILRYPARLRQRGRTLHVRQESGEPLWRGKQVTLSAGQRVVVE
jgi:TcpE family